MAAQQREARAMKTVKRYGAGRVCVRCGQEFNSGRRPVESVELRSHQAGATRVTLWGHACSECVGPPVITKRLGPSVSYSIRWVASVDFPQM